MRSPNSPGCVVVLPLAELAAGDAPAVRRARGRPRKVQTAPTVDEQEYHEEMRTRRNEFVEEDPLRHVAAPEGSGDTAEILDAVLVGLAHEQASLLWERERAQDSGKPQAETISSRRVDALTKLANLLVEREQLGSDGRELLPAVVSRVQKLFVNVVAGVAEEVLGAEGTVFMSRVQAKLVSHGDVVGRRGGEEKPPAHGDA
jgi:hypothetical protein